MLAFWDCRLWHAPDEDAWGAFRTDFARKACSPAGYAAAGDRVAQHLEIDILLHNKMAWGGQRWCTCGESTGGEGGAS